MSDTEALLLLIGVPAVVVAAVWALAWRGGPSADKRYRPGRPYEFATVWFLANHRIGPATAARRLEPAPQRPALPSGSGRADESGQGAGVGSRQGAGVGSRQGAGVEETSQGALGGASDRW